MAARTGRDDAGKAPGRAVSVLTLLLSLYAAGVATLLLLRGAPDPAASDSADVTPALRSALDEHARTLRAEIRDDLKKATQESRDQLQEAVRRLDERTGALQSLVDAGKRSADGLAKAASTRAELLEDRVKEMGQKNVATIGRMDALALQVRELERRPAAPAPGPAAGPAPAPTPEPAPAPEPEPAEAPKGPSPEQLAANKEKVKAFLAQLGDDDLYKALNAATELGRLGDLDAVDPLVKMLAHRDIYARQAAAEALGALQAADAVPALANALLDKDPGVFIQAGVALRRILGVDSQLSADSSRRDRGDARDRILKFWHENEAAVRQRLDQPKRAAGSEPGK
jgi:hypothetical protein